MIGLMRVTTVTREDDTGREIVIGTMGRGKKIVVIIITIIETITVTIGEKIIITFRGTITITIVREIAIQIIEIITITILGAIGIQIIEITTIMILGMIAIPIVGTIAIQIIEKVTITIRGTITITTAVGKRIVATEIMGMDTGMVGIWEMFPENLEPRMRMTAGIWRRGEDRRREDMGTDIDGCFKSDNKRAFDILQHVHLTPTGQNPFLLVPGHPSVEIDLVEYLQGFLRKG
jgi:hypothetical protein